MQYACKILTLSSLNGQMLLGRLLNKSRETIKNYNIPNSVFNYLSMKCTKRVHVVWVTKTALKTSYSAFNSYFFSVLHFNFKIHSYAHYRSN